MRYVKEKEGAAAAGLPVLPRADRVRYDEAESDLRQHYEATGSRDLSEYARAGRIILRGSLLVGGSEPSARWPWTATSWNVSRRERSRRPSARELGTLTKMLRLAVQERQADPPAASGQTKEGAARDGFFEREQFLAVRRQLSEDLQAAVTIAYTYGWRMQSEVLALERRQLDLEAGTLRLDPGATKNDEGRVGLPHSRAQNVLGAQVDRVEALQRRLGRIIPFLFPHRWKDGSARGRRATIFARRGPRRVAQLAWLAASGTTSGARRSGTSSTQVCRSGLP